MRTRGIVTLLAFAASAASCRCRESVRQPLRAFELPDAATVPVSPPPATGVAHVSARFASPDLLLAEVTYQAPDAGRVSSSEILRVDLRSGEVKPVYAGDTLLSWTVDGGRLVALSRGKASTMDLAGGAASITSLRADVVSPDGRYAACSHGYCLEDVSTGRDVPLVGAHPACFDTTLVSWSPDSQLLFRFLESRDIAICTDAELVRPGTGSRLSETALREHLTTNVIPVAPLWRALPLADGGVDYGLYSATDFPPDLGGGITLMEANPRRAEFVAGTADGRIVALRMDAPSVLREYQRAWLARLGSVAISDDGERVAASTDSGTTRAWSVGAEPLTAWPTGDSGLRDLHFDPSGNLLTGTSAGRIAILSIPRRRLVWLVPRSGVERTPQILLVDASGRAEGDAAMIHDLGLRRADGLLQSLASP